MPRRLVVSLVTLTFVAAACSSSGHDPATRDPQAPETNGTLITGSDEPAEPEEPERERVLPKEGNFVAIANERYTPMWEEPGEGKEPDFAFDTDNPFGQTAPLLIERATRRDGEAWYELILPIRPNGTTAWVKANDVKVRERTERLEVDLSERTLWHYDGDELVQRFRVGVGTSQYPTGTGRFSIWVKVPYENPNNPYGIMALGLSGFSPVLSDWPGEGRMAVHGTPYAGDRGQQVSHGCVRVYNADMEALVDLPLGTPVEIRK